MADPSENANATVAKIENAETLVAERLGIPIKSYTRLNTVNTVGIRGARLIEHEAKLKDARVAMVNAIADLLREINGEDVWGKISKLIDSLTPTAANPITRTNIWIEISQEVSCALAKRPIESKQLDSAAPDTVIRESHEQLEGFTHGQQETA